MDVLGRRLGGQARHGHDLAADDDDEAGAGGKVIRIVLEGMRGEEWIAAVCRREGSR
jgi:hypothetical protein